MEPISTSLAISFGTNFLSSVFGGRGQARELQRQYDAEARQVKAQNLALTQRNAYMTGLMNMQLGLTKKQLAQQGADVRSAGLQAKGMLEANAAASGTIGASVEAARSDIDSKVAQAGQTVADEWEQTLTNYNNDLESMRLNALNAVVRPRETSYKGASLLDNILGAALSTGANFASNYALQSMRLDLGKVSAPSAPSNIQADWRTNIPSLNYLN